MSGYGTLEWQEEQRRKDALLQNRQQSQSVGSSPKMEQQQDKISDNTEIIKDILQRLPDIITKGLESIKKEQEETKKKLEEERIKDKSFFGTTYSGNLKALENINKVIDGNLSEVGKSFLAGSAKLNTAVTAIVTGLKLANRITEKQAEINRTSYLLGGQAGAYFGGTAIERRQSLYSGMFGLTSLSKENENRYAQELSNRYALNLMSNEDLAKTTRVKAGLEGTFGALGVNSQSLDQLQFNAITRYGIETNQFGSLYGNLSKAQNQSTLPMNKFIDNLNRMSESSIKYEGSLEYATGLLTKFGKEINKGTVSLESLTAFNRNIAFGSVQQNAGIAAQLMQTGNLPTEALQFAGDPLSLAGWLRNNAENPQVQRAMESMVRNEAENQGIFTQEGKQEYFRMRYSQLGINLDNDLYKKLASGQSLTADEIKKITTTDVQTEREFYDEAKKFYHKTSSLGENVSSIAKIISGSFLLNPLKTTAGGVDVISNIATFGASDKLSNASRQITGNENFGELVKASIVSLIPFIGPILGPVMASNAITDEIKNAIKEGAKEGTQEGTKDTKIVAGNPSL